MDPLKKLVAGRLRTQPAGAHPDAEVLSAFAENALPASERQTVLEHLSTCGDCRDILFFSTPPAAETQPVLSAPKPRRQFALRWGTLAASVIIGAAVLVSRREMRVTEKLSQPSTQIKSPASAQGATEIVAKEKLPAELDLLRDKESEGSVGKTATHAPARGYVAPKAITAQPAAPMAFESNDKIVAPQVMVPQGHEPAGTKLESRDAKDLPLNGRNFGELVTLTPGASASSNNKVSAAAGPAASADLSANAPAASPQAKTAPAAGGSGSFHGDAYTIGGPIGGIVAKEAPVVARKDAPSLGAVTGTISDPSGAVIPNANITALGPQGPISAVSDAGGKFALNQLGAGTYLLKASAPGFLTTESQVAVLSDKPAIADFRLQVGSSTETVEVEAGGVQVQTDAENALAPNQTQNEAVLQAQVQQQVQQQAAQSTAEVKKQKSSSRRARAVAAQAIPPVLQWSLSAQGAVLRSNDNGKTWVPVTVAEGVAFRSVASAGNQVWLGGNAGILYHSVDYGQHWSQVIPTANGEKLQADITQIQLIDSQRISLTTSAGQTWTSSDGGQTWAHQ